MSIKGVKKEMQSSAPNVVQKPLSESAQMSLLIVELAEHQDKQAFARLFEYFAPRIKSYIFKLGSDETMAEELAQQTMLQVWRKSHLFDPNKAVASTWIFRIARNLRLDVLRKEKHFEYDDHDLALVEDTSDSPETQVGREEHSIIMREAITKLPQEQIEIIQLSFYEGLSHGEIAERLSLPLGTVKSRMRLAFKKLKTNVEATL